MKANKTFFYLRFFKYMYGVHVVLHGIDHDQHVPELSGDDSSAVISGVLGPDDVDLVVSQVSKLTSAEAKDKNKRLFLHGTKRLFSVLQHKQQRLPSQCQRQRRQA